MPTAHHPPAATRYEEKQHRRQKKWEKMSADQQQAYYDHIDGIREQRAKESGSCWPPWERSASAWRGSSAAASSPPRPARKAVSPSSDACCGASCAISSFKMENGLLLGGGDRECATVPSRSIDLESTEFSGWASFASSGAGSCRCSMEFARAARAAGEMGRSGYQNYQNA